jgi:hypothetical protein
VQLAPQLYDAKDKTVAEIAAIFNVPRTTLYGHLTNASVGTRPKAPKPKTNTAAPASATASPAKPVSAPDGKPGQQPVHPARRYSPRLVLLAEPNPQMPRPGGGCARTSPPSGFTSTVKTSASSATASTADPHIQPLIIECGLCGDGPLVTGLPVGLPTEQWPVRLRFWLRTHDWRTKPQLRCGNHR